MLMGWHLLGVTKPRSHFVHIFHLTFTFLKYFLDTLLPNTLSPSRAFLTEAI